jgi:short-subunit dehydrogenase
MTTIKSPQKRRFEMSAASILLLFGCGSNIGASTAEAFKAKGYNLALVSRSVSEESSTPTKLHIQADLSDTGVVPKIFEKVKEKYGSLSSVDHCVVSGGEWVDC